MTRVVSSHAAYEARNPDERDMAELYAAGRVARGLSAGREFPCAGSLRVEAEDEHMAEIRCDVCDWATTCRVDALPAGAPF